MTYPHDILITRPIHNLTVNAESGRPSGGLAETPVYAGKGWFQRVNARVARRQTGDRFMDEGGTLFLPPGEHDVEKHHKVTVDGCYVGDVHMLNGFTKRFYSSYQIRRRESDG